ncbi:hypothetical protein FRB94_005532 [Tulasnella sp. JGI-2019a]|nr:hypothetical protein FRB93_006017 [Tulasnella sp. JGI-2019a]KAG9012597.1 hypothetical protein FRB94_005532 [Tulasnella sp. JGI-2019a]
MESSYHIEKLTLVQHAVDPSVSNEADILLELLSESKTVDGVTRWPLPSLKVLEIIQHTWMGQGQLVCMIRNRHTDRGPREDYELPAKLQTLQIKGRNGAGSSQLEALKSILGPGVVEYASTHH